MLPGADPQPHGGAPLERVKELESLLDVVRLLSRRRVPLHVTLTAVAERLTLAFVDPSSVRLCLELAGPDGPSYATASGPSIDRSGARCTFVRTAGTETLTLSARYPAATDTAFLPEEERLLEAVVDLIAAHVSQLRELERSIALQGEVQRREAVQRSLLDLHERFLLGGSTDVASLALDAAIAAIPAATHGSVLMLSDTGRYRFAALRGYDQASLAAIELPVECVLFGRDWRDGRAFVVDDLASANDAVESRFPELEALVATTREVGARQALVAPVVVGDTLVAAISLEHTDAEPRFGDEDGAQLMLFAQSMGALLQRSRAEDAAELLRQAIDVSSDGIAIVDAEPDGSSARVRACNRVFAELLGVDGRDVAAWHVRSVLDGRDAARVRTALASVVAGASSARVEARLLRADHPVWIEAVLTPVPNHGPRPSVLVSVRDVTERRGFTETLQRLNADLEQRLLEARTLEAIDTAISHGSDETSILAGVMHVVRGRPDVLDANLLLASDDGLRRAPLGESASVPSLATRSLHGEGVPTAVLRSRQVLEVGPDEPGHPFRRRDVDAAPSDARDGVYVAWPLTVHGGVSGVLELLLVPGATPDAAWRRFMHGVSAQVAVAVEHAGLIGRLQRAAASYAALARFNEAIEQTDDPADLIDIGVRTLLEEFGMQRAGYFEVDADGALRSLRRWGPLPDDARAVLEAPQAVGVGAIGRAVATGEPVHVADYATWPHAVPEVAATGIRSILALPVRSDGSVRAAIGLGALEHVVALRDDQVTIARAFVRRLERALERLAYERQIVRTREEAFRALGVALEHRDYETKGHTDRVVALARRLGERVGVGGADLDALTWGAYLHDLGKIAIPDQILLKPGTLDAVEFELVKRHAVVGYDMSRDLAFLPEATREVVRSHHERWDGTGYPDGLAAASIPYLARLFAVVDVFDALTSERPYKRAWPFEQAVAEIEAQAGRQFDPQVSAAMVALLRDEGAG